ncbi:Zn-dependent protease with chaperone function [Ilumatobacter fluminis]|uniref:Zn-dependent protease with chaperone function n=1 Tax=Ilumatobacter fluminis TaxID=467091 RepID=A0A4R7I3G0_9ACTN|nr:M48 family metallopeptidase [Ilumatobacter fluminis]TDT18172.1 Zn-dependent protease with chaperone function [Ilumatobacter fluminis]
MTMDFTEHQHDAKQNTVLLVALLTLGILAIVAAVSAVATLLASYGTGEFDPVAAITIAAPITAIAVIGTSLMKSSQIRRGGGAYVATSMGGRQIDRGTTDVAERRLVNVVDEMSIASGSPVPDLFVLDQETSINAFAAGWSADRSAIGVTRGALDQLTRSELQGVVAHEYSHITNGDTRVKTRIIGWVFGIAALTVLGRVFLHQLWWSPRRRGRDDRAGLVLVAAGFALIAIGSIGTLFARLVQAAVSRQREYLADATAVQFTRDPDGIGSALMKIGGGGTANKIRAAHATEADHLFFTSSFSSAMASHPPLQDRIRRLVPSWNGRFITPAAPDPDPNDEPIGGLRPGDGLPPPRVRPDDRPPTPWFGPPPGHRGPPGRRPPPPGRGRHRPR